MEWSWLISVGNINDSEVLIMSEMYNEIYFDDN